MRVLVTGATGFVGRNAIEPLLSRGFEVHATTHAGTPDGMASVHWHEVDLIEEGAADRAVREIKPSHLLHCAWYAEPGKFWNAAENLAWVAATLRLIGAFAENGGQRFVGVGSCAEYDWTGGQCIEDETPLEPATLYGAAKLSTWQIVRAFAETRGMSAAWGRLFFMYGPGEHPSRLVSSVVRSLLRGEIARCTTGEQERDFLYVADCADALVALLASDVRGAVNIGSGTAIAIRDLVSRIADELNARDRVSLGAVMPAAPEVPLVVASPKRLNEEVGWTPRVDHKEGISRTIAWWRARA